MREAYGLAHAGGRRARVDEGGKEFLRALLKQAPDLTLREVCERFHAQFQRTVSISAMNETLRKMRITRKKRDWSKLLYTFVVTELPTG